MITLDEVLSSPGSDLSNPVIRWLKGCLDKNEAVTVELQKNSATRLDSSPPRLAILRSSMGESQPPQVYDWDDDLNSAMIGLGIRAENAQQEGERFSRVLRSALRKVERKYGDGYLNAVMVDLIDESSLGRDGEIGKIRKAIHSTPPHRSHSYEECRDAIAGEIGGRAKELRNQLKYDPEELKAIMDKAIAQYLDERFSISNMRRLGWIDENGRTIR